MHNNLTAPWDTGDLSKGLLQPESTNVKYSGLTSSSLNLGNSSTLYNGYNYPYIKSDEDLARERKSIQLGDLRTIIELWKELKNNGASETLIQSYEDTIARYTAEIFYLDDKPLR